MTARHAESPINVERGVALAFAALLALVGTNYMQSRPAPVADDLRPPRMFKVPPSPDTPQTNRPAVEMTASDANPFLLSALLKPRTTSIANVVPPDTTTTVNRSTEAVYLPSRPKVETPTEKPTTPNKPDEAPFPLKVIGIVKFEDGSGARRVMVTPTAEPGNYFTLSEGEEWAANDAHLRAVEIAPTYAVFQWDGRTVRIDLDPLKDWAPILKDEKEDAAPEGIDDLKSLLQPDAKAKPAAGGDEKKPRAKTRSGVRPLGSLARPGPHGGDAPAEDKKEPETPTLHLKNVH